MASPMARDQSKKRAWSRRTDDSYMFSVRIKEPLLSDFRAFCEAVGLTPCDVMRDALRWYMDDKVFRILRKRGYGDEYGEIETE